MVKAMDCGVVVSEFVLQSRYYVQFRANTIGKGSARGVMVIVAGYGHGDTSSDPGLIAFHIALISLGKV